MSGRMIGATGCEVVTTQLTADNSAVQAHLGMMQDVIRRMADNSRSCKLWCVTLVSATLVLTASISDGIYPLLALVPILALGFLDVYYLSLEQRFRYAYNEFVTKLHDGSLNQTEVFVIKASGGPAMHVWKSVRSTSVWVFYVAMVVVIVAVAWFM